ncbi:hypothetical protein GWI33_017843 [Rhynchophorus ferrugineus]|uniref:FERM domain-containing protein n=1 Tax=Rhynchophorus ferrugineus TaxID=354439 RepID=A0A834M5V1_RHYFE|nr:hypothetical protein GWI33_017843 [Rhynchophorus ferrugineus]
MEAASGRGSTGALSSSVDSVAGHTMHHSLSTPAGVDSGARTPPATPKKGGKMLAVRVQMLDDAVTIFQVQAKALGKVLFDQVCKQLHLLEADYFGLEYADMNGTKYWLDLQKPISRQLGLSLVDPLLYFCVKFYTPDPAQLEEEYTRYLFCLQVKRDLAQGIMQCNDNTAAMMASYIVQAECGDYVPEDYPDHTYLSSYKFVPQQDQDMEKKIMENHKKHAGQSPAEADVNLLETARRCELYGIKMHPAKDHENVPLNLAVAHMGIIVFQNYSKINTFSWAKIRKISFKRKRFLIKLHPEGFGYYKDTVEFFFEGRNECKNFWKKCVENHGFFRCSSVKAVSRHKTRVLSRGSSFRYSGKTQKQIVEFVRDNYVKRQTFQRSHSFRHSSAHSSASNMHTSTVGNSISAHPLLPLADSSLSVEASKLSASLGSMGAAPGLAGARRPASPTTRSASRPLGTATSWSSAPDTTSTSTRPSVMVPRPPAAAPTTSSPSPTETRSASAESSATASPLASPPPRSRPTPTAVIANRRPASPLAVRAAVHRADTGTTRTHISSRTPSSHKSEGSLDHPHQVFVGGHCPSQTQSQNDVGARPSSPVPLDDDDDENAPPSKRKLWQRSASCRELHDFSFEETGRAKRRAKSPKPLEKAAISLDERKQDSPVTVYDDHRALYSASSRDSSLEIQQDIMSASQKVYSSSFPGTTSYSQESVEDPGNYDLRDSQDDLSHDSYELIEKSDDSTSGDYKKVKPFNTRSCSLDSGNYLPSDSESERGTRHKYKSVSDQDLFLLEDPRDFPREIVPRKSDGSFYKAFKQSSRTSSLESKSDYYESKTSRSSKESLKKARGVGSRTSSQESRSDYETKRTLKKNKSDSVERYNHYGESRASSVDSKSEYFDANSKPEDAKYTKRGEYDRKISFERNYGTQKARHPPPDPVLPAYPDFSGEAMETEQSLRVNMILNDIEQNTTLTQSSKATTHIWPESIVGLPTEIEAVKHQHSSGQRSTESESNIFSFDEDRIQSLQESSDFSDHGFGVVPNIDAKPKKKESGKSYREVFMEIEPRICHDLPLHQPIERTKSDPNSLARQRLNSSSRRLLLMHQKSIDLTPAESSDEDYLYKQIPSAPPITKFKGTHFEIPTAEFGHFDILKREIEGQKTKFEVPKSQFEVLGVKDQADLNNLPPKGDDIPYVLHKRHIMNGTAMKEEVKKYDKDAQPKEPPEPELEPEPESSFLFTQNIDLSKVNPVTLEVDKSVPPIQHVSSPKRDITHIDPVMLETLNSKLSQIESDSPTSSKTESLKPAVKTFPTIPEKQPKPEVKTEEKAVQKNDSITKLTVDVTKTKEKIKTDIKPKRVIKPRMQPGKKGSKSSKTKVRITSFSSDDESLDSDDVFGSAEATPTRIEFSPPQMRKEMESILKFESERKYLQYTMSSTEVEGSPPTTRKKTDKKTDAGLDPNVQQTELRRISERSFSIPSSEDEFNIKTTDMAPVFAEPPDLLKTVEEADKEEGDKSLDETLKDDQTTDNELTAIDDERQREKALLKAEIENDLKDLKVPPKTKITEIVSPSARNKGQSPLLFAHARLNLSEGSAFSLLQKQQAVDSPLPGRRARSLDAPVIPVNKLPPLNAFSCKDDTVEEEDQQQTDKDSGLENNVSTEVSDAETGERIRIPGNGVVPDQVPTVIEVVEKPKAAIKDKERDQIVPDLVHTKKKPPLGATSKGKPKLPPRGVAPPKPPKDALGKKPTQLKDFAKTGKDKPKLARQIPTKIPLKPKAPDPKSATKDDKPPRPFIKSGSADSKTSKGPTESRAARMLSEKAASADGASKSDDDRSRSTTSKSLPSQSSLTLPEIKRTKSQEMEPARKTVPKEKAKSLEKLELRRMGSKERTKSQEESEEVIAERRKLQQMLYETAIKQTKTLKSPVKDVLPVFPQVEETVRERGGKLEISINTIEPVVSLEEAIIVTKSPKKLDKKLDKKLTKSLELNLNDGDFSEKGVQRMGKSLDLERSKSEDEAEKSTEFDFKPEAIKTMSDRDKMEEVSPEMCSVKETVTADIHTEPTGEDHVILEGTSLDVWISVGDKKNDKLKGIEVVQDGRDFFEPRVSPKAPDLAKLDAKSSKSSSESMSMEKLSLGNSLDIKYIDESGESSCKSDKDRELMQELQKASDTVGKFIRRKLERRRKDSEESTVVAEGPVRITSEDESLTEVSELRAEGPEPDRTHLTVTVTDHKEALLKLSIERSKSEDTGSWMTVECEEYVGAESSLDYDNAALESPEKQRVELDKPQESTDKDSGLLGADTKQTKLKLLKKSSDQSKSSDTGSWTSGEKEVSPSNVKETDESSVSCSMGRAIGLSQNIEMFASKEQLDKGSSHSSDDPPKSPRSPRSPRICVLGRAFTIDEGSQKLDDSSSDEANDIPKDLTPIMELTRESGDSENGKKRSPYPFEQKWSQDSELGQKLHKKLSKKLSSTEKGSLSSMDESISNNKRNILDKPNLLSIEKLSTESRNSLDTESSSGSLGAAARMHKSGDIPKELSSTWKPFPLDSSGSESFDDNLLPPDQDFDRQEYFLCRDPGSSDFAAVADIYYKSDDGRDDTELPEDLANFNANFAYPSLGNISATDVLTGYTGGAFLSRTLSRISERSTNSEKSSLDEDSTKASTQSDSLNDESMASSNPQVSISSESPSNAHLYENEKKTPTNDKPSSTSNGKGSKNQESGSRPTDPVQNLSSLLQRQISDDRRTSAEMAELSMDDIEIITSERGLRLKRQGSDDTIIDEECFEEMQKVEKQSSQESEDWPLPEIPSQGQKPLLAMHEVLSSDTSQLTTQVFQPPNKNIPKTFGLRNSLKSQDSEQWPSPPSSVIEPPITDHVETYYISPPQQACKVTVDSTTTTQSTYDDSNSDDYKTVDLDIEKTHTYENVIGADHVSESLSESLSVGPSGIKIVLEEKSQGSNSDEDLNISNLNDDVFMDASDTVPRSEQLRPPTALRRSTASDDSRSDKRGSQKSSPAGSHSSYSEEDCTSSMGTNLEDGTVRYALKPTKCTHSSHSEDTSIALSLSEWSNSTNTVKFQNLSSNSGTKSSSGLKSDENSLTDIAQSISEWSTTNSSTLKVQQQTASSHPFQKLSSTTSTGESTLTELIPSISEWSNSDTKPLVPQQFFPQEMVPTTRLGSSVDIEDLVHDQRSPKNIPSEDFSIFSGALTARTEPPKFYTKSTERPIVIPVQIQSDTEKSSSSIEQHKTVHTQRYDKDKKGYLQKYHSTGSATTKSSDRPVKVNLKLSKCSPYYSSSLSSESTPLTGTSPVPINKTATVPLTRIHRKPVSRSLTHAKSPPSENDSTSSVESPKSKSERERRGYRRKRQLQNQRNKSKSDKEQMVLDEYYYVEHDHGLTEYSEYIRERNMEQMASNFQYEAGLAEDSPGPRYVETLEEGYFPDGDSQSGSDIFRMEREEEEDEGERFESVEGFDVSCIPPPLLEDDFEGDPSAQI